MRMNSTPQPSKKKLLVIVAAFLVVIAVVVITVILLTRTSPAVFKVTNLVIEPAQAQPGEEITIKVTAANTGGRQGNYTLELKINNDRKNIQLITLAAKASQEYVYNISENAAGTYAVNIGGLSGQFTILKPVVTGVPSVTVISDLNISPATATPGEEITITAIATNSNGIKNGYTTELKINNKLYLTVTIPPTKESRKEIEVSVKQDKAGIYTVDLGGLTGQFTITAPGTTTSTMTTTTTLAAGLREWVITDADVSRLFAQISSVSLVAHFIPGNVAEFTLAKSFSGTINIGVLDGKLCEFPIDEIIYNMFPEIKDYIFFNSGKAYLAYTWFDPSLEIAKDVTEMPVMVSVTTENGKARVIYEWPPK
jgi:hypothetical protein